MSEETPPPALRLKPRLRPEGPPSAPPPIVPSSPATAVADLPVPTSATPAPKEAAVISNEQSAPPPALVPAGSPDLSPGAAPIAPPAQTAASSQVPSVDPAFFKLKPRVAPGAPVAPVAPPSSPASAAEPTTPSPLSGAAPLAATSAPPPTPAAPAALSPAPAVPPPVDPASVLTKEAAQAPSTKAVVSLRPATKATPTAATTPAGAAPAASATKAAPFVRATPTKALPAGFAKPVKVERPENSRAFKTGVWAIGAGTALALTVGGFMAFRYFLDQDKQSAPVVTTKPAAHPAGATTPSPASAPHDPVVASPESMPGKMVGKARDVVAAREASGQVSGVNEMLDDPPEGRSLLRNGAAQATRPTRRPAATSSAETPLDATAGETSTEHPEAPPPSAAFKSFVANLRISGVFQGDPGRALINGRTIRVGEVADRQLGIWLSRLDAERKILYFEDQTGSTMQRRY